MAGPVDISLPNECSYATAHAGERRRGSEEGWERDLPRHDDWLEETIFDEGLRSTSRVSSETPPRSPSHGGEMWCGRQEGGDSPWEGEAAAGCEPSGDGGVGRCTRHPKCSKLMHHRGRCKTSERTRCGRLEGESKRGGEEEEDHDEQFAQSVCESFHELLYSPSDVVDGMRPVGAEPGVGDALLALPTLVHRGPGGNDACGKDRMVLFFTLQPEFALDDESVGTYDPETQIHAGWILWRAAAVLQQDRPHIVEKYREIGFEIESFGHGGKVFWEEQDEPRRKKKVARKREA